MIITQEYREVIHFNLCSHLLGVILGVAALATTFDLRPEQPTRIHTKKVAAAIAARPEPDGRQSDLVGDDER